MASTAPARAAEDWRAWPIEGKRELLAKLRTQRHGSWREHAHPNQLPPPENWNTLFLSGGRGSGKTWAGSHIFRELIENDPIRRSEGAGEWAVIAPTFGDARDKCIESTESGLLLAFDTTMGEIELGISPTVAKWNRSIGELVLHDGTKIQIDGADDGAYRIQGLNLRGAWCDEVGLWKKWKTAWRESIAFALRKGQARRIATGTPKRDQGARMLVKELLEDPRVVSRRLLTAENWENLSEVLRDEAQRYVGTELGRQELEGILLEEREGAMWQRTWIEEARRENGSPKGYRVKVMGLDPADGTEDGDEQAWTVAGIGLDNELYVLGSTGMRTSPGSWLEAAVRRAHVLGCTIVIEKNHGGAFLVELLERVMVKLGIRVPYRVVTASQGKLTRAEPAALLYEQHKVHHVGDFPELEDQMCMWTGAPSERSPDRMDSLVWAIHELKGHRLGPPPDEADVDKAVAYTETQTPAGAVPWR